MARETPIPKLEHYNPSDRLSKTGLDPHTHTPNTITSPDSRWTWVEDFLLAKAMARSTQRAYQQELRRFIGWTSKGWQQINHRDIAQYKDYLTQLQDGNGKPQLSTASIARALTALKSFFKWLSQQNYVTGNPAQAVSLPSLGKPESKHLTDDQVTALHRALIHRGDSRQRDTAILGLLEHGLRAEEVSALNIRDYDGERVRIQKAKHDSTGIVPLSPPASQAIDTYLNQRQQQGDRLPSESPLFLSNSYRPQLRGKRLGYQGIYSLIKDLGAIAGIENCYPHRLRHTYATRLVLMGIDSYLARKLTRHESENAFRRYSEQARAIAAEAAYRQAIAQQEQNLLPPL